MKKAIFILALFSGLALSAQTKIPKSAIPAFVLDSYDGDNIGVAFDTAKSAARFSCRILGMDAPERLHKPIMTKEQPGAMDAKNAVANALPKGSIVMLDTSQGRDRYDRLLVRVWWKTGFNTDKTPVYSDLTAAMISSGLAWYAYNSRLPKASLAIYSKAEKIARLQGMGIWNDEDYPQKPVDPRTWKKKYGTRLIFKALHPKLVEAAKRDF